MYACAWISFLMKNHENISDKSSYQKHFILNMVKYLNIILTWTDDLQNSGRIIYDKTFFIAVLVCNIFFNAAIFGRLIQWTTCLVNITVMPINYINVLP